MTSNLKKLIAILVLSLVGIFLFRFVAGFFFKFERVFETSSPRESSIMLRFADIGYEKAVSSNLQKLSTDVAGYAAANISLLEVFAKEARMRSSTSQFEKDEVKTRSAVNKHGALIRIERKEGLKPNRMLQLVIRVPESKFDGLINDLQTAAVLDSFQVVKEDKSEEAKKLLVEKKSLEEYRKALIALRKSAGKVEEFLALEGKIQDIQRKIEELDTSIGKFAGTEPFNNVSFDLGERMVFYVDPEAYPISARIADALLWSLKYYLLLVLLAAVVRLVVWSGNTLLRK
jgi:hypothetical protein